MTSFVVDCNARAEPRLAAAALLLHILAAGMPWATRCPPVIAGLLSVLAFASLGATLARIPGPHCRLQGLAFRDGEWRVRIPGESCDRPARIGRATRVHAGLIAVELIAERRRLGWLLTRKALDPCQFRRLKARLRLAC